MRCTAKMVGSRIRTPLFRANQRASQGRVPVPSKQERRIYFHCIGLKSDGAFGLFGWRKHCQFTAISNFECPIKINITHMCTYYMQSGRKTELFVARLRFIADVGTQTKVNRKLQHNSPAAFFALTCGYPCMHVCRWLSAQ